MFPVCELSCPGPQHIESIDTAAERPAGFPHEGSDATILLSLLLSLGELQASAIIFLDLNWPTACGQHVCGQQVSWPINRVWVWLLESYQPRNDFFLECRVWLTENLEWRKAGGNKGEYGGKKPAQQLRDQEGVPEKSLPVKSLRASLKARAPASVSQWAAGNVQ